MPLKGKILNTWEVETNAILDSNEVNDISTALESNPALRISRVLDMKRFVFSPTPTLTLTYLESFNSSICKTFPSLVTGGHVYVAMPPLYRIDHGREVYYALDDVREIHIYRKYKKIVKIPKCLFSVLKAWEK